MLSIEIRAGASARTVPLSGKLVLGPSHGLAEGALELEPRLDGAVVLCRSPDARIGKQKLPVNARRLVRPGESIELGGTAVALVADAEVPQTRMLARAMLKGVAGHVRPGAPSLVWLNGPELGKRVVLLEEATFLGRGEGCAARLNDAQASRLHAKIVRTPEGLKLVDLMSANGVLVDGERLTEPRLLRGGETVQVGHTLLGFEVPTEPRRTPAPRPAAPPPPVEAAKPVEAPAPKPLKPSKPSKPTVTRVELGFIALALFALGAGGAVIAWAIR